MLSGGAAERKDSSEREKEQSALIQPSGTELSLNPLETTEHPECWTFTELPLNQPEQGTELSHDMPSGTELPPFSLRALIP